MSPNIMHKTIAITGYNRPQLFATMLASLVQNSLEGWTVLLHLEPSDFAEAYCFAARSLLRQVPLEIVVNPERLGVRANPFVMLNRAFADGADLVLYLEDDILLASDTTRLATWYHDNHAADHVCLSLLAGGCTSAGLMSYPAYPELLFSSKAFNSLGFAVTAQHWQSHFHDAWMHDSLGPARPDGVNFTGWDIALYNLITLDDRLQTLCPAAARAMHIGRDGGEHCTADFHDRAFGGLELAVIEGEIPYRLSAIDSFPPQLRQHANLLAEMCALRRTAISDPQNAWRHRLLEENAALRRSVRALLRSRWRRLGVSLGLCGDDPADSRWLVPVSSDRTR